MQVPSEIPPQQAPKLLDQVRAKIRFKHYSIRTEQAYTDWIKRFILHFGKKHPREMGAAEIEQFLTHLAARRADKRSVIRHNHASLREIHLPSNTIINFGA